MRFVPVLQAPEGWRLPLAAPPPWPRTRLPFTAARSPPLRKKLPPPRCGPTPVSTPPPADMLNSCFGGGRGRASAIGSRSWQNHARAPNFTKFSQRTVALACWFTHFTLTCVTVFFSFPFLQPFLTQLTLWREAGPGRCNPAVDRTTPECTSNSFQPRAGFYAILPWACDVRESARPCYWFTQLTSHVTPRRMLNAQVTPEKLLLRLRDLAAAGPQR